MKSKQSFYMSLASTFLLVLIAGSPSHALKTASSASKNPIETGQVQWFRDLKKAISVAKTEDKPIFILFQEVPGCITCQNYGQKVLSHPLVVESIENLFIPVAIFNNRDGSDAQTLRQFGEPAWNNPVVRIVSHTQEDIVPRLSGDYSVHGLVRNMIQALENAEKDVPPYLLLLEAESRATQHKPEKGVFGMSCFWSGEVGFGALEGVVATKPGFLEGHEVVEVLYNPQIISYRELVTKAKDHKIASVVFSRNQQQKKIATQIIGAQVQTSQQNIRPDRQPKYHLSRTLLQYVPMTEMQAMRINTAIGLRSDPFVYLSPRQLALFQVIRENPEAGWMSAIGTNDLTNDWNKAIEIVYGLLKNDQLTMDAPTP